MASGHRCAEEVNAATATELPHHQTQAGHQCQGRGGRELPIPGIPFPNLTTDNKTRVGPGAGQGVNITTGSTMGHWHRCNDVGAPAR